MQDHITAKRNLHGAINMATLSHTCSECDSEFKIKYDEEAVEDRPTYCPFCGSYIIEDEEEIEDDDE